MSKITSVNNANVQGAEAIYILKATLKTAGWTVPRSSDGTTYNATGDEITQSGSGANGMNNSRAWFVVQSPNGEHQWCFQRETDDTNEWRVKVSALDGFTGGAPSATQVPSATDEQILHGSGTDASPTMEDLFTAAAVRFHVIAENAAVGTAVPIYPFWAFATNGSGQVVNGIMQEAMDPNTFPELSSGTRAAPVTGDPDPCIYMCHYSLSNDAWIHSTWRNANHVSAWYRMNYVDESYEFMDFAHLLFANDQGTPPDAGYGFGSNPYDGSDQGFPLFCGRGSGISNPGKKGWLNHLKTKATTRNYPDTVNLSSGAKVYLDDFLVPWEDGTAPLI